MSLAVSVTGVHSPFHSQRVPVQTRSLGSRFSHARTAYFPCMLYAVHEYHSASDGTRQEARIVHPRVLAASSTHTYYCASTPSANSDASTNYAPPHHPAPPALRGGCHQGRDRTVDAHARLAFLRLAVHGLFVCRVPVVGVGVLWDFEN